MTHRYVALLRAINAGVKLPMPQLKAIAEGLGYDEARTYIASGNLLFKTGEAEATVKRRLEAAVADHLGKPVWTTVRTGAELAAVVKADPFPDAPRNRVIVLFLDEAPPEDFEATVRHLRPDEELKAVGREIFVRYGEGMGQSKLTFPLMKTGTGRNLNTVAKLAEMAGG